MPYRTTTNDVPEPRLKPKKDAFQWGLLAAVLSVSWLTHFSGCSAAQKQVISHAVQQEIQCFVGKLPDIEAAPEPLAAAAVQAALCGLEVLFAQSLAAQYVASTKAARAAAKGASK